MTHDPKGLRGTTTDRYLATKCPACDSANIMSYRATDEFTYGHGMVATKLRAEVTVYACESCGTEFCTADAEDARDAAVTAYKVATR